MNRSQFAFPRLISTLISGIGCLALLSFALVPPSLQAQTSIQLFAPVNKRASVAGTGYGAAAVNFNSSTLNLTCSASPIVATLSSTADSTGNLLVDNNINVSVTPANGTLSGPTNVCVGGVNGSAIGIPFQNCFTSTYEFPPAGVSYDGLDPDTFVSTGGVAPFSIANLLVPGNETVTIALQDEGFSLASSTLYLNTNCTQNGVTGPALVTGNPISGTPSPNQVSQDFSFNPLVGQQIGFEYDLSAALAAGSLTVTDGTIPQVGDMPLDPAVFQSQYAPNTSFSTSSCLIHSGEVLANGSPACKLYTLECTVGTGASASGAQCPVSLISNEIFNDVFDGPNFTLSDLVTPNGTFHTGVGLIMANEGWTGGECTFDAAAGLGNTNCPQNLLTSFSSSTAGTLAAKSLGAPKTLASSGVKTLASGSGSGGTTFTGTGQTTRPNSTFLSIAQIPEPLTTVSVVGWHPGNWINSPTADVSFSTAPPNLNGTNIPGASTFVPSPIFSLTYGISTAAALPSPGTAIPTDTVALDTVGCPTPANPTSPAASVFNPQPQVFSNLADGHYLVHYFAQDCSGTQELKFLQDGNGNWSTNFYTYPINVDTVPPVVTSGPTIVGGTYAVGQVAYATYSCSDAFSGIATCGSHTYTTPVSSTGAVTTAIDTSSPGPKVFTVMAIDAAGNTAMASVNYSVVANFDNQLTVTFSSSTVTYPGSTTVTVKTSPINVQHRATGTVQVYLDGTMLLGTLTLGGAGNGYSAAYYTPTGLNAGQHGVTAVYGGDAFNPAGTSAPALLQVLPAPVTLKISCVNPTLPTGANFSCNVYTVPVNAGIMGSISYALDNGTPIVVPLANGTAAFTITKPAVGSHSVVITDAPQPNYMTPAPQTVNFKVNPASH